jgi:two-component system LytT family response regulator
MTKAIIVEDEEHSRKTLVNFLQKYCPQVVIAGTAASVDDAVSLINFEKPNIVFLDIDLPDGSGFEVLDRLNAPIPDIIFVTAYNQYAVKAFQVSAIDYILKPVDPEILIKAVEKSSKKTDSGQQEKNLEILRINKSGQKLQKMALPTHNGIQLIRIEEIIRLEADGNYTTVFLRDKRKIVVSRQIKHFEEWLDGLPFFRIHQTHIINLEMIERYIKGDGGTVLLEDGSQIEVARRRKEELLRRINSF